MSIAQQIKTFHGGDISAMIEEADGKGVVTQDWENESTEFDFVDGSVLIICGSNISTFASR